MHEILTWYKAIRAWKEAESWNGMIVDEWEKMKLIN